MLLNNTFRQSQRPSSACRDSSNTRYWIQEAREGSHRAGERRRPARLPHQGRLHRPAPRHRAPEPRIAQDPAGIGRVAQLQGQQGPNAPLLNRNPRRRADFRGNAAA